MKIRCSSLGKIMTSPKSKGEVLSQTSKTYLKELAIEEKFGIRKEFSSRYTDKGNIQEDTAIEMASKVLSLPFALKNTKPTITQERFENGLSQIEEGKLTPEAFKKALSGFQLTELQTKSLLLL